MHIEEDKFDHWYDGMREASGRCSDAKSFFAASVSVLASCLLALATLSDLSDASWLLGAVMLPSFLCTLWFARLWRREHRVLERFHQKRKLHSQRTMCRRLDHDEAT